MENKKLCQKIILRYDELSALPPCGNGVSVENFLKKQKVSAQTLG